MERGVRLQREMLKTFNEMHPPRPDRYGVVAAAAIRKQAAKPSKRTPIHNWEGKQRRSNIEHLSLHLTYDDREFEQLEAIPFALRTPYDAQFWQLVSGNNRHLISLMISPRLE